MSKTKGENGGGSQITATVIDDLGDDLMQNLLSRLPALSFSSAACVNRSWNSLCHRVFSAPKLCSAVSFNPILENAVNEVVDKVLQEPIRPHFVMASISYSFDLQEAFQLIEGKFGSRIPVIVNVCSGVIGRDVITDQFVEVVPWETIVEEDSEYLEHVKSGISLTVGFLPGLKAHIIPLLNKRAQGILIDDFVMDISEVAVAVSNSTSPAGIIMFSDQTIDINPVLQTLEYAFSEDTFIVGDGSNSFLFRSDSRKAIPNSEDCTCVGVALLFARDRNKPSNIGETQFHVMLSTGISPIGPTYKAVSVKCQENATWLTASKETVHGHLDGQAIVAEIFAELGDRTHYPAFYIGATKRRKCSVGKDRVRRMQFLEFHDVWGEDGGYLMVDSVGIKTGDPFRFYISDSGAALASCTEVSNYLSRLSDKRNVFGGIAFSCRGRGDAFFELPGIDSSPFLKNFPGVTFGGTYCAGEICRRNFNLHDKDNEEGDPIHYGQHVYSAVYLVMSYYPPVSHSGV